MFKKKKQKYVLWYVFSIIFFYVCNFTYEINKKREKNIQWQKKQQQKSKNIKPIKKNNVIKNVV